MTDLRKSTGGFVGTAMALATILGSGMMILPGTSYQQLGGAAWIPWTVAAVSVLPLLYCYGWLGRRHPSASGLAYYSEIALGSPVGRAAGLLVAVALTTGIPATAITGGLYVAEFSGIDSLSWAFPVGVLAIAVAVALAGASFSGKLQVSLILCLFALVLCTAVVALSRHGLHAPGVELPASSSFGGVLTAVYVAFTGWETVACTFEEYKRPDLIPRIFVASYLIVVALYALLLLSLFATVRPDDEGWVRSLLLLAERSLGTLGRPVTVVLVVAAITANVVASVLALSRLVFGMARSGHLPAPLGRMRGADRNPVAAVLAVGAALMLITVLGATGLVRFELLFIVSGGIYFVLYGIGAAAFAKLTSGVRARAVSVLSAVTVVVVTLLAGPPLWLGWALFLAVWFGTAVAARRPSVARARESR